MSSKISMSLAQRLLSVFDLSSFVSGLCDKHTSSLNLNFIDVGSMKIPISSAKWLTKNLPQTHIVLFRDSSHNPLD